jgi:uncharacterized protein with PQ loop repeat
MTIDKNKYYYLILFATFLFTFSFIPLVYEIIQQKITINIPYSTLVFMLISFIIYLFITISRQYYYHIFLYLIGFICISIILFLKRKFDKNNIDNNNIIIKNYKKS